MSAPIAQKIIAQKITLAQSMAPILGVGAFLKNTLCLIQGNEAWISVDNGSLDTVEAVQAFETTARDLLNLAREKPLAMAHDLHPDFACTRYALASGLPCIAVQHHHAHIASIMAEWGENGPILGLALDGFGLGLKNESWGGELLRVDSRGFDRIGHLLPLPQPGGDKAAREPWRMGAAALWAMGKGPEIAQRYSKFPNASVLASMMDKNLNCPQTSSAGRLFDAACGLLGVKPIAAFEGEAPIALEALANHPTVDPAGWNIAPDTLTLDLRPLLNRLLDLDPQTGANVFHGTLAAALADWLEKAAEKTGLRTVALGGGCFYNKALSQALLDNLRKANLTPLQPKALPCGDPALALGQAYAAALSFMATGNGQNRYN